MPADLYVDQTTRQIINLVPAGRQVPYVPPNALLVPGISDEDALRIHDAWKAATQAGEILMVAVDLTTSTATAPISPLDQAVAILRAYLQSADLDAFLAASPPTNAQSVAALKDTVGALRVLIRVVRGLVQQ